MIKATFDAATLADAAAKAARIAPNKGAAYDRAAGLLIEVDPPAHTAILKATNLDMTYEHRLVLTDGKGTPTSWRIPSALLAGLLSNLPMGTGATVTFHDKGDRAIRVTSGTTAAKMQTIDLDGYPPIPTVDRANVSESQDFASKVAQVAWACAKDNTVLSGIRIDGESLIACDRASAAIVPCKVPIARPVTAPLFLLAPILRSATDVRIGADDRNLMIVLDAESQATSRLIEGEYPDVKRLLRDDYTGFVTIHKTTYVEIVNRLMVMGRTEKMPRMSLEFRSGLVKEMILDVDVQDTGRIQDRMPIGGEYEDDFTIDFTPQTITAAIENCRGDNVRIDFGSKTKPDQGSIMSVRVTDDTGYEALVMPRRKV